jgi:type I restriction enzyme S subunit
MASEWPKTPLGELVQNFDSRRVPLSSREREKRRGAYPYYGATGVMDHVDDFLFEGLHLLVAEDGSVERPDGKPFLQLVDGRFWVNNHAHVLRGTSDEDTKFLYYALSTVAIRPYMSGSVQAKLSQGNLNRMPTPYPSSETDRRAIAYVLGTLDDKIELNRRMSETLEAMARALFKSWFVDFEPVRAKMEGRWRRGQSLPGLPAHLYDLFPDRLVPSELGEIPEGWEVVTLAHFAVLNPETWSKDKAPDQIEYVDLSNTKWGRIESTTRYPWENAPSRAQRILRSGDTIVGTVRPANGSYTLVSEEGLTGSTGFAVLRPRRPEFREFVYLAATAPENIERLAHLADGAAYPAVRPEVVVATHVVKSSAAVVEGFSEAAHPLLERMAANDSESRTLASLRDALLPKLISGELRVKDAERFLKERGL